MVSGIAVLQETDARLADLQREASAAQAEADQLAARREGLRQEEAAALRQLAELRLAEIKDGKAALERLDAAGTRVQESLRRRAEGLEQAQRAVLDARDALAAAEATRDAEAARHRAAQDAEAEALRAADARAQADDGYRGLAAAAESAERVAQHAEQKAAFAQRDFEEKGKPYRDDPLFAYLWDRGYGTAAYRAFPLVRLIDGWVARLAGFESNRRSYALLSDLPGHMSGHAQRMREAAEAAVRAMVDRRRAIAGLPAEAARPAAAALAGAEDTVEAAQATLAQAEARRSALASGGDAASQEAIRALEQAIGSQSLRELREQASRTPNRDDDAVVARLEVAASERGRIEAALQDAQRHAESARQRLNELQSVRRDMRSRGVERSDWNFASGALIGALLSELLRGALSRDGFWEQIERHRRPGGDPWGRQGNGLPGPWDNPLPGPWGQPAPGPWGRGSGGGSWGDDDGGWGLPGGKTGRSGGKKGGGWGDGGGFATGGRADSGGGFKTGGSV